ncbi:MAG: MurR/RpiR family transcriptional regulator [Gammaproteobacteria bacterium]|nr:MurR/RpiR family transcriptional regulator [Gammaproteobacteria bacterium]
MGRGEGGESIVSRIRARYEELPPSERKLASLILDFPGDMAGYSATELATLAGVSKAAATRLFRRLGYVSFEAARRAAREEQAWGSPLFLLSQGPELEVTDSHVRRLMEQELANMARTFEGLDVAGLEHLVDALISARRLWLLGYRNSHFLADYARWQFLQVRDQVQLLQSNGATLAEQMVDVHTDDIVVAFGFRRRITRFRQAIRLIHTKGIPVLYITEPGATEARDHGNWVLHAEVSGAGPFDSYPAACSLIHLLSVLMIRRAGRTGRSRIQRIEELHADLNDFD